MQVQGLHLLLTYKCNARCRHCFLSAGPERSEVFSEALALKVVEEAGDLPAINHLFLEGGEPFLYPKLMEAVIARATGLGLWTGALTNGFWAVSDEKAKRVLEPLAAAGLQSLSISTDAWHEEFVPLARVEAAAEAAAALGVAVDVMVCGVTALTERLGPAPVHAGGVVCRGRAISTICLNGNLNWESLTKCHEGLSRPGRVHIGPAGEIHLCQGLLLGEEAGANPLKNTFANYAPQRHPIVSRLLTGGPAALARFAAGFGFVPRRVYVDGCQLCFETRSFLRRRFPRLIGPAGLYAA